MLETLAGRLKWERMGDGIRVELPVQFAWPNLLRNVGRWLSIWVLIFSPIMLVDHFHGRPAQWGLVLLFAPLYAATGIWEIMARKTELTLNPREMSINQAFFQKDWSKRTYATLRLHHLLYCKSRPEPTAERRAIENSVLCDVEFQTIGLFDGITEEEADALIAKMIEVYPFPKDLPAVYTAEADVR
jgi:hypothetical protein